MFDSWDGDSIEPFKSFQFWTIFGLLDLILTNWGDNDF